jgi:hypothetical protein
MITSSVQLISSRLIFKRRLESLIHDVFIVDKNDAPVVCFSRLEQRYCSANHILSKG